MRKVLILTSLPQRDRETDEILAVRLRDKGFEVRVTDFLPMAREHVLFYKPDILIGPEARCEFTIDLYRRAGEWGVTVIAKRTEGGAAQGAWDVMEDDEKVTVIGAWEYAVDKEVVWSQDFANLMAEHGYIPEQDIFVAGALPMDVYFLPPKPERVPDRRNIVIATGWGHADRTPEYNVPEAPPESSIHKDAYDRHRYGRDQWIKMVRRLHEVVPDAELILRLKVGEYPKEYQEKLGDIAKIASPCTTRTILTHADLLLHAGSTMAIEAHLMDVPALSFLGDNNQTRGYVYPHVSPNFDDIEELMEAVKTVDWTKSNANTEAIDQLSKEFYGQIDGNACKRVADMIESLPAKATNVPFDWPAEDKEYEFPGASKHSIQWVCESCKRITYTLDPTKDMLKCLHCGVSLARRLQ